MNYWGKSSGIGEAEERKEQQRPTVDRLFSSSSSRHEPELQPFFSPFPYQVGEPSTNYEQERVEREHMFDKVVTPSDVGKLNRLVIPKQHAERFFPLDSSNNDKGLQLNFEDRSGKLWRFRYSYWNSSQSYVMTKGWSRFVKEKKLDAGDVVSFQRGVGVTAKDRLFIDWRRRVNISGSTPPHRCNSNLSFSLFPHHDLLIHPWNPLLFKSHPPTRNPSLMPPPPNSNPSMNDGSRSVIYFRPGGGGITPQQHHHMIQMQQRNGKASGKRLRLFGVNMDCQQDEDDQGYFSTTNPITSMGQYNYGDYHHGQSLNPPSSSSSSSLSSSSIPFLQLSRYGEGNETDQSPILQSESAPGFDIIAKSTASSMSLDLDI